MRNMVWCIAAVLTSALVLAVAMESTLQPTEWWHTAVIYQVYVRSFIDSDADGVGDINGLIERLYYFRMLGVQAICLSPIFQSPMLDEGYDISDFRTVDPMYGGNEALEKLILLAKFQNLKVLLDFVPNHSSDEHGWFVRSLKRVEPYTDYYVWHDGKVNRNKTSIPDPPNNWLSRYGGSAWKYSPHRNQYYLHTYLAEQPDFNFRHPPVVQEIKDIMEFWLQKGVDGFRMVGVVNLFESGSFLDEPLASVKEYDQWNYDCLAHSFTTNLHETLDMVLQWRGVMDKYKEQTNSSTRLLIVDADTDVNHVLLYYGNKTHPGALPLNPIFLRSFTKWSRGSDYAYAVRRWYKLLNDELWPSWVLGTPDVSRVASRISEKHVDALHMLTLLLPGTAFTYFGEELGMQDRPTSWDEYRRTDRKDQARTPFQWDSSRYAGFTTSKRGPWLGVNRMFSLQNLFDEQRDERSHYSIYSRLVGMRQEPSIAKGNTYMQVNAYSTISFSRTYKGHDTFVVVINFGDTHEVVDLKEYNLTKPLLIHTATKTYEHKLGEIACPSNVRLPPHSAVVLTTGQVRSSYVLKMPLGGSLSPIQLSSAVLRTLGVTLPVLYSICN